MKELKIYLNFTKEKFKKDGYYQGPGKFDLLEWIDKCQDEIRTELKRK